jgi:hypothetical protein
MHDVQTQQRFVELRATGWSFARIASELKVSRGTLIHWSRKFQFEIQNHRAIEMESLREQLLGARETRAKELASRLQAIEKELATRNLADLSTSRLFQLADSLRGQIARETGEPRFTLPLREIPDQERIETVHDWQP